jgi:hypothetical protein
MKASDGSLQRLFKAAAKAPSPTNSEPPFGLETRVLACWRAAPENDVPAFLFLFLRRATIGASLILLLSAAWSLSRPSLSPAGADAALLDYQIQMSLNP